MSNITETQNPQALATAEPEQQPQHGVAGTPATPATMSTGGNGNKEVWENDPATGIKRLVVDSYSESEHLPGATQLPSHSGQYGAQKGQASVTEPMPFTVDPDEPGGGIVVDPGKITRDIGKRAAAGNSLMDRHKILAAAETLATDTTEGQKQRRTPPRPPQALDQPLAQPLAQPAAQAAPVPEPAPESQVPAGTPQRRTDLKPPESEPPFVDLTTATSAQVAYMLHKLMSEAPTLPTATEEPVVELPKKEIPYPEVEVTLQSTSGIVESHYHAVQEFELGVVLIFDTRFKYGTRFIPTVTSKDAPYRVKFRSAEQSRELSAHYLGIRFRFGDIEYLVLQEVADA